MKTILNYIKISTLQIKKNETSFPVIGNMDKLQKGVWSVSLMHQKNVHISLFYYQEPTYYIDLKTIFFFGSRRIRNGNADIIKEYFIRFNSNTFFYFIFSRYIRECICTIKIMTIFNFDSFYNIYTKPTDTHKYIHRGLLKGKNLWNCMDR